MISYARQNQEEQPDATGEVASDRKSTRLNSSHIL